MSVGTGVALSITRSIKSDFFGLSLTTLQSFNESPTIVRGVEGRMAE